MHLVDSITDSLAEGSGHSKSCGRGAVFCLWWAWCTVDLPEMMWVHRARPSALRDPRAPLY